MPGVCGGDWKNPLRLVRLGGPDALLGVQQYDQCTTIHFCSHNPTVVFPERCSRQETALVGTASGSLFRLWRGGVNFLFDTMAADSSETKTLIRVEQRHCAAKRVLEVAATGFAAITIGGLSVAPRRHWVAARQK